MSRPRSDIAIALALLGVLLANTLLTGTARMSVVYVAIGIAVAVAVMTRSVWLSVLLAAGCLAAVVVVTIL